MNPKKLINDLILQEASEVGNATSFLAQSKNLNIRNISLLKIYIFALLSFFVLSSCEKEDEVTPQPEPEPIPVEEETNFSGTVKASPGQTVAGTYVMACYDNNCEDKKTKYVKIEQEQASASFEIKDLAEGEYSLIAWKDNNANMELDAGDGIGFLSSDGKEPELIAPPKDNIVLEVVVLLDSGGSTVDEGSIAGTVTAPDDYDVTGTVVIACQWDGTQCVESTSQAIQIIANGAYLFSDLAEQQYFILAWKDLNNSGEVDSGDLYGIYVDNGTTASVLPPSQGIDIAMTVTGTTGGNNNTVPGELTGEWVSGSATAVDYYNPTTGGWAPPSGTGMYLKLYEDGSFELSSLVQVTNYNCTSQVTTFYRGVAVFNGNELTLEPTYTRQKYHSNCYSHLNYDKEVPNSPIPFHWRTEVKEDGSKGLILTWLPEGGDSFFYRP